MHIHRLKARRRVSIAEEWRQLFIFKSILTATHRWAKGLGDSGTSGASVALTQAEKLEEEKSEFCLEPLHDQRGGGITVGCIHWAASERASERGMEARARLDSLQNIYSCQSVWI